MRDLHTDDGQATLFVLGMALVALAVTFFAIEGTRSFLMRRTLQNAADAAAIAGASQLDESAYYSSGGMRATLDPGEAEAAGIESLAARGLDVDTRIEATQDEVAVRLRTDLATPFLRFIGIHSVPVSADARAEPVTGSAGPE